MAWTTTCSAQCHAFCSQHAWRWPFAPHPTLVDCSVHPSPLTGSVLPPSHTTHTHTLCHLPMLPCPCPAPAAGLAVQLPVLLRALLRERRPHVPNSLLPDGESPAPAPAPDPPPELPPASGMPALHVLLPQCVVASPAPADPTHTTPHPSHPCCLPALPARRWAPWLSSPSSPASSWPPRRRGQQWSSWPSPSCQPSTSSTGGLAGVGC